MNCKHILTNKTFTATEIKQNVTQTKCYTDSWGSGSKSKKTQLFFHQLNIRTFEVNGALNKKQGFCEIGGVLKADKGSSLKKREKDVHVLLRLQQRMVPQLLYWA